MTCAVIARCDGGGLAALTREVHRHMRPERTLLLDLEEQGRGDCVPNDYEVGEVYRTTWKGAMPARALEWLTAGGVDTLWTAEFWYGDEVLTEAHGHGIRTIMYAMPELAPWQREPNLPRARQFAVPTGYRIDNLPPNTQLLPFPVARDRLPYKERTEVRHLYHPAAHAMRDRNGTELMLAALPFVVSDGLRLTINASAYNGPALTVPRSRVQVDIVSEPRVDYWEAYPADIDLLVMPRRYGGLSLPVQECASLGVPALMLQTDPYARLEPCSFVTSVPSTGSVEVNMKGGYTPVYDADPRTLAAAIDYLVEHPSDHQTASIEAGVWAESRSWDGPLGDRWCHTLGCER